jgi:hypothetical protein
MQTAEQQILERISVSRGTTEPEQSAPTENIEAVNVSEDAPIEEVVETEAIANEEVTTEIEEPAEAEIEQATTDNEDEDLYVEYKGREINLKDIDEWEQGHLRQADYTRKTQELADSRKDFEAEQEGFTGKQSKLSEQLLTLEAMIAEDNLSDEALTELREYEPEQYINHLEKQSKRKEFLKEAKVSATPKQEVNLQEEQARLIKANPQWLNDGKATDAYTKDMDALSNYYTDNGFTQSQVDAVNGNALIAQAVIEAARAKTLGKTNAAIEKRVRKAPVSTRPRSSAKGINTQVDNAQKAFNKNPSVQNAAALRTAKRQLNN